MTYNGHRSWPAWNVSLWIGSDEGLYRLALSSIRRTKNRDEAARDFLGFLNKAGTTHTPDGALYTVTTIKAAMRDM